MLLAKRKIPPARLPGGIGRDGYKKSKIRYFQPILANCRVDMTIFILYRGFYWIEPVGVWCRINSDPICCYSFPAVTQPCRLDFLLDPLSKSEFLSLDHSEANIRGRL